ncbi:leucine-rich repeat transmembrane neuronal protein 4-like isoform X2 [Contarinia nasturtii]|uniref:leucine-rich repeat transmembrane neuronal protein 4-like isoform X2 n=1 Tax=Contarinia nasturtii TaxID=265458 RepID=UPI0012D3CBB4|nr:leucine-rich repeat transmembrane neuronal protein 4-like isoform X2 [Contarinia nasturtii]
MRLLLLTVICYSLLPSFHTYLHRFVDRYVNFYMPCTIQADDLQYTNESCAPSPWIRGSDPITELQIICKNSTVPRSFLEKTPNVEFLRIRNNSLTSIDGMSICQWKRLQWIDADFNSLRKLTNGFLFFCKQLNQLLLHNNKIKEIASDAFIGLKSLRYLDLSSNQITYLDKNVFKPLKKLENLNLNTNRIQIIDIDLFRYNMLIGVLDLSNNDLKTIPSEIFQMLDYLEVFSADNNPKLGSIDIRHPDSLKVLNIANVSQTRVFIPSNVEEAFLNNNQISQIFVEPDNTLFILGLSGNCITSLLLEGSFNNLETLSLSNNPIQLQSISVVKIKTKYPSIKFLFIPTIDDRKAEQMILEAEENQIDLAVGGYSFDDIHSLTYLRFAHFDSINFENYNQKIYITSSVRKYFTNKRSTSSPN